MHIRWPWAGKDLDEAEMVAEKSKRESGEKCSQKVIQGPYHMGP